MGYPLKQSQIAQPLMFLMVDSTDKTTGKTGLSPTVTLSKNGGTFASPAGAVTEVGSGWYKVAGNATDSGTLGPLVLHATGTGADPCDDRYDVVAYDPQATSLGLTLAKTTNITGFNDIAATAVVSGGAITTSSGAVSTVTTVGTLTTNSDKTGYTASTVSDKTGYSLASPQTFSLTGNITGNLSGSVGSVTGNVGGNVTGSVGSIATGGIAATSFATDALGATAVSAAAVTKIQAGLSTYAGGDTSGTTTLLTRIPGIVVAQTGDAFARIGVNGAGLTALGDTRLVNLDAAITSRMATFTYTVPPTTVAIRQEIDSNSTKLAQLAGAFTGSTSVFTAASLVNAPAGEGGGGSGASLAQIQAELDTRYLTTTNISAMAAVLAGNLTENASHTTSSFTDIGGSTPRVTSANTATTRTVTVN